MKAIDLSFLQWHSAAARQKPTCRAPGAKEKAKSDAKNNNLSCTELLSQDNVQLLARGARSRSSPSTFAFSVL